MNKPVPKFQEITTLDNADLFHVVKGNVDKKMTWLSLSDEIDDKLQISVNYAYLLSLILAGGGGGVAETLTTYTAAWSTQTLSDVRRHYYFVNASDSTTKTINLFATPTLGDLVLIKDKKQDAATYNITINGNGKQIDGSATILMNKNGQAYTLKYDGAAWNII